MIDSWLGSPRFLFCPPLLHFVSFCSCLAFVWSVLLCSALLSTVQYSSVQSFSCVLCSVLFCSLQRSVPSSSVNNCWIDGWLIGFWRLVFSRHWRNCIRAPSNSPAFCVHNSASFFVYSATYCRRCEWLITHEPSSYRYLLTARAPIRRNAHSCSIHRSLCSLHPSLRKKFMWRRKATDCAIDHNLTWHLMLKVDKAPPCILQGPTSSASRKSPTSWFTVTKPLSFTYSDQIKVTNLHNIYL